MLQRVADDANVRWNEVTLVSLKILLRLRALSEAWAPSHEGASERAINKFGAATAAGSRERRADNSFTCADSTCRMGASVPQPERKRNFASGIFTAAGGKLLVKWICVHRETCVNSLFKIYLRTCRRTQNTTVSLLATQKWLSVRWREEISTSCPSFGQKICKRILM